MWTISPAQLLLAVALDALLGHPRHWPHLAQITGRLASVCAREVKARTLPSGNAEAIALALVGATMLIGLVVLYSVFSFLRLAWFLEVFVLYQTVAAMDLTRRVRAVWKPLQDGRLSDARAQLATIVSRDTEELDEREISRAAIESVARGACSQAVAPLFWAALAGVPGALLYHVANTIHTGEGRGNERHELYGRFVARVYEMISFLPARLTGVAFTCLAKHRRWHELASEAAAHPNPNVGWPESGMAHALGVQLGGTSFHDGVPQPAPILHPSGRRPFPTDIPRSLRFFWIALAITIAALLVPLSVFNASH